MAKIEISYDIKDKVYVDGCVNLIGIITAIQWRNSQQICYEVSWVTNGEAKSNMIEGWRLSDAKK